MNFDRLVKQRKLSLVGRNLTDADLATVVAVLRQSAVVEELNLMCNRLTLADGALAAAIATNKTLKVLGLYNNAIGPEGAQRLAVALKTNASLEQLALEGNKIGDAGAEALANTLAKNSKLSSVVLRNNGIGDRGARSLANALLFNGSVRVLLLGENAIGNAGAQRLADALEYNSTVDQLALDNNACSAILERRLQSVLSSASRKSNSQAGRTLPKSIVDALLDEKAKEVAEMERQIAALMETNEEKDGKIARRDRALVETLAKLEAAEGRASELEKRAADPVELLAEFLAKKDGEIAALRSALAEKSSMADGNARRTTMDPPATEADDLEKVVASMEAASLASSSGEESAYSSDGSEAEDVPIEELQGMVHVTSVSVEASWSGETDGSEEEAPGKEDQENEAPARLGGTRKVLGTNASVRYAGNAGRKALA
ncbi:hypothetical protein ACHAXT_000153 [Thalassiosira profunda]